MKQVKFRRTELSVSVSGPDLCALSENKGLSLGTLQVISVLMKNVSGKALLYCRTEIKQVKLHRTELSLSVSGTDFCALSTNEGLSLGKLHCHQSPLEK